MMTSDPLARLFVHYDEIIAEMPATFKSHEFIRRLARRYQVEYIEALYHYRDNLRSGKPAPFLIVHGILAQHLQACDGLVTQIPGLVDSVDIFGDDTPCSQWRKK